MDGLSGLFLPKQQKALPTRAGERILSTSDLTTVSEEMRQALEGLKGGEDAKEKVVLVIDQVDLLLAAGGDQVTANELAEMLLGLREVCDPILDIGVMMLNPKARLCNNCHSLGGLSVSSFSSNTFRNRPRSSITVSDPPSRLHHELKIVRFRDSKRC